MSVKSLELLKKNFFCQHKLKKIKNTDLKFIFRIHIYGLIRQGGSNIREIGGDVN
jgi:hypothetical protein